MVALVMCLFVLAVAGVLVIRMSLVAEDVQRATTPRRSRRASPPGRARATARLLAAVTSAGLLTGVLLAALVALLALALRSAGGSGP